MLRPTPGDPWGVEQHHWNTGAEENKPVLIGHFYRNPVSNIAWNESFDVQIEKAAEEEEKYFYLGILIKIC